MCTKSLATFRYLRTNGSFGAENSTVPTQRHAHEISLRRCFDPVSALSKFSLTQFELVGKTMKGALVLRVESLEQVFLVKDSLETLNYSADLFGLESRRLLLLTSS